MNATFLNERNVLRTTKRILSLAGVASLALSFVGSVWAQSKPAQTEAAAARSAEAALETSPAAKSSIAGSSAQVGTEKTTQAVAQSPSAKSRSPKGEHEGIAVHGRWTIEVRNPDGKVVSHTEFENSYVAGSGVLPAMLSRSATFGEWGIVLGNSTPSQSPCVDGIASPFSETGETVNNQVVLPLCVISESGPSIGSTQNLSGIGAETPCVPANGSCSQNLAVATSSNGNGTVLTGSVLATNSGTINQVESLITECGASLSSTTCATETAADNRAVDNVFAFSFATLPAQGSGTCGGASQPACAVPVTAGQSISVTVTFSFQ